MGLIKMCSAKDKNKANPALKGFWTETLEDSHPGGKDKFDTIDPDDWHKHFLSTISGISDSLPIFRLIGEEKNLTYKKVSEITDGLNLF